MIVRSTRDSLAIFFDGEESPGITVYGYWPHAGVLPFALDLDGWDDARAQRSTLAGDEWTAFVWDVRVPVWPGADEWPGRVQGLLAQVAGGGAVVAWTGFECGFADPPDLFKPEFMTRCVWAARAAAAGLVIGPPPLDGPLEVLDDQALLRLREVCVRAGGWPPS